jgi:hypothetical protein
VHPRDAFAGGTRTAPLVNINDSTPTELLELARASMRASTTVTDSTGSEIAAHRVVGLLAALIDVTHALLMAAWVLGLPLLFWHRWPRWTRAYAIYAIAFVAACSARVG